MVKNLNLLHYLPIKIFLNIYIFICSEYFLHLQKNKLRIMAKLVLDITKLEMAASKLRAIAHPMRIAVIDLLNEKGKLSVTEIYSALDIEQAAASHHLNILKNKGVLASRRQGKKIFYSLKSVTLTEIIECINKCNEE